MNSLLPQAFIDYTRQLFGEDRFERYLASFSEDVPVSIRLHPRKAEGLTPADGEPVPWCRGGYYLHQRPAFTMDPLLHAGCYYVQEAASMFLDEVLRQHIANRKWSNSTCLDLCAAPGGKSTLLRAALPADCVLYSNEPIRNRAAILAENVEKWNYGTAGDSSAPAAQNHFVTNCYPAVFRAARQRFDVILCDVPCSGEGMFRKDSATIREWSPQQVEKCWQLQREIVDDAWACLNPGGLLIYSTCTFNTKENEENVRYFLEQFDDMQVVPMKTQPEWHITGSLLDGFTEPVYRFIPGITRGEGLFLCVLQKEMRDERSERSGKSGRTERNGRSGKSGNEKHFNDRAKGISSWPHLNASLLSAHSSPKVELSYPDALRYLRGEALRLPDDTPRGEVTVCFQGHPLGLVKNIGPRANNLYPKPWRIKTTHLPDTYQPVLRRQ